MKTDFLNDSIWSLLKKNSGPAVVGMLIMALYQIVDGIMVGRRLGAEALAAINILYPVLALIVGLAVMIGTGGSVRIAVQLGRGNTKAANKTLGLVTLAGIGLGIMGALVFGIMKDPILGLLGSSESLNQSAGTYLGIMAPFSAAYILMFILDLAVRNDGKASFATLIMISSAVLNIVLDYVFLFVLDQGIGGAALASGLSQSFGAGIFLFYFGSKNLRGKNGLCFAFPVGRDLGIVSIITNGSSELFTSLALGITTLLFNRQLMNLSGSDGVAAYALIQYILMVTLVIFQGTATGAQPILSQNYGAGKHNRVRETLVALVGLNVVAAVILMTIAWFSFEPVMHLFIPSDPAAYAVARAAVRIILWSVPFMPLGIIGTVFFTSLEKAGTSLFIAAVRSLVLPIMGLLVLPRYLGLTGVWAVPLLVEGITVLVVSALLLRFTVLSQERAILHPVSELEVQIL